jgi:hypothetical protein
MAIAMTTTPTYKIFDVFSYNGEEIALFRIKYLFEIIDKFIIIEARETHSGIKKDVLYFETEKNKVLFEAYMSKIIYIVIDTFETVDKTLWKPEIWMSKIAEPAWICENYQRNYASDYLLNMYGTFPYYIYCGNVDEIPHRGIFNEFINGTSEKYNSIKDAVHLEMTMYSYNFNWKKVYKWYYPFITTSKCLVNHRLSELRYMMPSADAAYISNAGWHCSHFHSADDIIRKISSYAHREYDVQKNKTIEHIHQCFISGKDIFNRGIFEDLIERNHNDTDLPEMWMNLQIDILNAQKK